MACRFHRGPGARRRTTRQPAGSRTSQRSRSSSSTGRGSWGSAAPRTAASTSSWQPPPEPKPPPPVPAVGRRHLTKRDRERVKEAAEFCADVLAERMGEPDGSWQEAWCEEVAERLTDRAGDAWQRLALSSRRRRRRYCKMLARMARTILNTKDRIHDLVAELAGDATKVAGVQGPALDFTKELVRRIPLPLDVK